MVWRRCACAITLFLVFVSSAVAQDGPAELRTRDGRVFFVEDVQVRGDQMIVRPRGLGIIEIPVADILCMGADCARLPSPQGKQGVRKISIQGSNTIGASLMPTLVRRYGGTLPGGDVQVEFGNVAEEQTLHVSTNGTERLVVNLASHGSSTAFKGLLEGTADIGMASRAIKPAEVASLKAKYARNMLASDSEHVIGLDGLAVIVNNANPVRDKGFTTEMLARIFSGEAKDWSEFGAPHAPISIHARDEKSGTYDTFNDLVLKPYKKSIALSAARYESSEEIADAVAQDPNAIGFIGLAYVRNNHALSVASSCGFVNGPSRFAIQTEVYPLARRLFLYTLGYSAGPPVRDLVDFISSETGQKIVRETGFVDQSVEIEEPASKKRWLGQSAATPDATLPPRVAARFASLAQTTRRTSVAFRFTPSSTELDGKAAKDAVRVAGFLRRAEWSGRKVYVVGFSDISGEIHTNLRLARDRAKVVAAALAEAGVKVPASHIVALGPAGPVACNSEERGRALNRRVEIWIGEPQTARPKPVSASAAPKPAAKGAGHAE
jgi:phosphate transport system substrate-binding protein